MSFTQHFEVNGRYMGACKREGRLFRGEAMKPESWLYICPLCGELWARAWIEGARFVPWLFRCERHPSYGPTDVPGTLWMLWDPDYTSNFPPEIVKREFRLTWANYERWLGRDDEAVLTPSEWEKA